MANLQDTRSIIRIEFPTFTTVMKKDSRFMKVLNVVLLIITFGQQKTFMDSYTTTIWNCVYLPSHWDVWSEDTKVRILAHERVHMRQAKKYSFFLFALLYLFFPLPFGLAYMRARFEWEAYQETMRALAKQPGGTALLCTTIYRDSIVQQFTTGAYGWMWPFTATVNRWYAAEMKELLSNK